MKLSPTPDLGDLLTITVEQADRGESAPLDIEAIKAEGLGRLAQQGERC